MNRAIAARIAGLGPAQREVLEQRLARTTVPAPPLVRGDPAPARGPLPTSAQQRSQWFVHQLDPGDTAFNKTDAVRVYGRLDVAALDRALTALVTRHEVLRTVYRLVDGQPRQIVRPAPDSVLQVVEWDTAGSGGGPVSREVRRAVVAEASRPFDLASDLMYRAVLHRLGDEDHILTRTTHHVAFDKWSSAIANRELGELYAGFRADRTPALSELPLQYRDYAAWQRTLLSGEGSTAHVDFFAAHLAGAPTVLDLPTDHERPARATHRGGTVAVELPMSLVDAVRSTARGHGATPFMVLLAVYGALLGRYAREEQLLVGIPVAGRGRQELEALIGVFINTVAVRVDLRGDPTFSDLVRRIRRAALGAMAHQDLPFDELVRTLAPQRLADRTPLFQVMFDYINTPEAPFSLDGVDLERMDAGAEGAVHDLTLYVHDHGSSIRTVWEYRADLFDRPTVAALAEGFVTMAAAAVSAPERAVAELPLLAEHQRQRIRRLGSGAGAAQAAGSVVGSILRTAGARPDATAVEHAGATMTYRELSSSVTRLAGHLRSAGTRRGERVGVLIAGSPHLATALLGVMAAGACPVLLDPAQPEPRLRAMITGAGVERIVVAGHPSPSQASLVPTIVDVVGDGERIAEAPEVLDEPGTDDPAYVVFTSGSTGAPKGVVVGHGSLANFVADAVARYELEPSDRVLQFAVPGFDTVIEELLPGLVAGATIVMRPHELFPTFEAFRHFVDFCGITVLDLPTAWWHAWVDEMEHHGGEVPSSVRLVIVGGEAASVSRWSTWRRLVGNGVRWVNTYGPSEATVVVATFEPPPGWRGRVGSAMPIGYPIANAHLAAVDGSGHEIPPHLVGELIVTGTPVALGYLGKGGGADGFGASHATGEGRNFRTGDLVRMLPDGLFEFVGRTDRQVKIRGTRVEPGEVEAALRSHPAVKDAAVVVANGRASEAVLAAHLVAVSDVDLDIAEVRRHAAARLPEPMVPAVWRQHGELPLTAHGKIDRDMLAGHGSRPEHRPAPGEPPATETERRLAALWCAVLDRDAIGRTDDFFDLGGHSLLGVRLISRIAETFGAELPLRVIFDSPTVASMAERLDGAASAASA